MFRIVLPRRLAACIRHLAASRLSRHVDWLGDVLYDGKNVYKLSDQQTPQQFAGQKVRVTGTLFAKTGIIQAEKIEQVN